MQKPHRPLCQGYHSDSCSAELRVLIAVRRHSRSGVEGLTDGLTESPCAGAVENPHFSLVELNGIVKKICNGLKSLVHTHAAHIELTLEL